MKKKSLAFKYNDEALSSFILCGVPAYLILVSISAIIIFLAVWVGWGFLLGFVLLGIIYTSLNRLNRFITLDEKFMIVSGQIIWYKNIETIKVNKVTKALTISTLTNEKIKIVAEKFPTNARKPAKILKNKSGKFFKVSEKILGKIRSVSPATQIVIN